MVQLNYSIMITGPAYGKQRSSIALQFCESLLKFGHHIILIFFYHDGVYNANLLTSPSQDEINLVKAWQNLSEKKRIKLDVCISSAMRRGILNSELAKNLRFPFGNLNSGFQLSSLGKLSKSIFSCDRFIQF